MLLNKRSYLRKLSDEEIVSIYKRKQWNLCIDELYRRYSHLVFGVCLKYVKQIENAEDLTVTLFSSLSEKLLKHQVQHFKSWLYVTARNSSLMFLRSKKNMEELKQDDFIFDDSEKRFEEKLEQEELLASLTMLLEELKKEQRICIHLFYYQRKCYEEVASLTGFNLKEVKSHLQNGRRNLKNLLEQRHHGHGK